jgi:tetratricopeptide (TPR) repeat protein
MSALQGFLFAALALMVPAWFACVRKLSQQLLERHAEKYEEMGLAEMWPQGLSGWLSGFDNSKPSLALLWFLFGREDRDLHDADVSSLSTFMRWFFCAYLGLFSVLVYSIVNGWSHGRTAPGQAAVEVSSPAEQHRDQALDLYREQKWPEAIAAFDALLQESDRDAERRFWRGMAHWKLGHTEQALQDFRRAIELEPTNFDAHRGADRILSRQQRWDEILEMWDRYIFRVPTNAEAYFERGGTYFHKKDLAAAQADAARACELGKAEACAMAERLKSKL